MTAHHDLDRELTAFLREGPTELPDESLVQSSIAQNEHDSGSSSARGGFPT